jgi:hypothetical protein
MKKMLEIIKTSGVIPQSEFVKLTLMMGILLVLVGFYGWMMPSLYRFILLPFMIGWAVWFVCRLVICVFKGLSNIVRGIGK